MKTSKVNFIDAKTKLNICDSFIIMCSPEDIYTVIRKMNNYSNKYIIKCFDQIKHIMNDNFDYIVDIFISIDDIKIIAYEKDNYGIIIYYEKEVVKVKQNKTGNCVDDFIRRGVKSQMNVIYDLVKNIEDRLELRSNLLEYHKSSCYEHDFRQIVAIRNIAQKIVNNCNIHLERSTDEYTKLNY